MATQICTMQNTSSPSSSTLESRTTSSSDYHDNPITSSTPPATPNPVKPASKTYKDPFASMNVQFIVWEFEHDSLKFVAKSKAARKATNGLPSAVMKANVAAWKIENAEMLKKMKEAKRAIKEQDELQPEFVDDEGSESDSECGDREGEDYGMEIFILDEEECLENFVKVTKWMERVHGM